MASWKALPGTLDPQGRQLVVQLRSLKDRSRLSLAALERRTTYSRSSWERYLNGKKLPPAGAVKELAILAGGDVHRLLAMHSLAEETWSQGARPTTGPAAARTGERRNAAVEATEGTDEAKGSEEARGTDGATGAGEGDGGVAKPASREHALPFLQALMVVLLTAVLTAAGLIPALHAWGGDDAADESSFVLEPGRNYGCTIHRRGDALYAGHSQTEDAVLFQIKTGWDVVEAQCLLAEHGYPVGDIDGAYDAQTARAVKRFQEESPQLAVDGIVGPHTWKALRR
ncbi:peptidoglycan-binding protein [Streptomyces sp. 549]|uniref:peptidoglycan-binding protein n=1 Tax=Streptomyces sp. 549 TaxID=3049076 RepID=UPI0024C24A7F|nr:peptidoglycan-binding protein [Streptomyces sp. 549]MDK1473269.1 peptidoglycan-binding protein [Streptomyces sp. 549]